MAEKIWWIYGCFPNICFTQYIGYYWSGSFEWVDRASMFYLRSWSKLSLEIWLVKPHFVWHLIGQALLGLRIDSSNLTWSKILLVKPYLAWDLIGQTISVWDLIGQTLPTLRLDWSSLTWSEIWLVKPYLFLRLGQNWLGLRFEWSNLIYLALNLTGQTIPGLKVDWSNHTWSKIWLYMYVIFTYKTDSDVLLDRCSLFV